MKKVTAPKLGEHHKTTGSIRPSGDVIHLKNDAFPEPIDNIHTFRIKLPCPGVVNFVPEHDDDYLLFPRIKGMDVRVYHKTTAMAIPGNSTRVGEIRPKNVGIWMSTDTLSEAMKLNPNFPVLDEEDLVIKYNPNGFRMFRNTCQKISLMDDQDMSALGVTTNTLEDARTNLEKIGGVFNVRPRRSNFAGMHLWDISNNYVPEPLFITTESWSKDTGQLHSDSCYLHLWLEEGVIDSNTTIWYTIDWSLEKVTAKEMWYYQNRVEQRQKLIDAGSYLNETLKAYREKQQLVYSVKGIDDDMCYLWKTYITNGNIVPYLAPGIVSRDVAEIEPENVTHKAYDKDKPFSAGDVVLPDETLAEFAGPGMSSSVVTAIEGKEGIALDKDAFVRKGVLYEQSGEIKPHDELDAPPPPTPPPSPVAGGGEDMEDSQDSGYGTARDEM